ncbi:MAG: CAP domain-containing protein [Acidimicrobiales bacterium]|nr:CAP domain-containing protein [Actinomycetota bacterium]
MSSTVEQTETATRPHRRPRRALIALAVAVVGALALAGCYSAGQQQDMDLVNSYRRANGAPAAAADAAAMAKAQAWSEHMAATGVMEHTGGGTKLDTRGVSGWCSYWENVGYGSSVEAVHNAFRNSPTHRSNMLSPAHRIGTGVYKKGTRYWVTEIYLRNC